MTVTRLAGYGACDAPEHEDDFEAMECAAGNPRYRCVVERRALREFRLWIIAVPLAILTSLVMTLVVLVMAEEIRPWLRSVLAPYR